jgi:signal peptidase I
VTIDLVIAGKRIRLQSDEGINLRHDERFVAFTTADGNNPDLTIEIKPGRAVIPAGAAKVFNAPLLEDAPAGPRQSGEPFWEVAADEENTYVKVSLKEPVRYPLLIIPIGKMFWQLFSDETGSEINPLSYPLDGLILYFLTSLKGDIMIHGSGVICDGKGWVFTGKSGSGKTTIARIFDRSGDRVIHDDRLILAKEGARWKMHSTPVYRNDEPRSAEVDHLWIISHGKSNISTPLAGAEAAGLILANCIQQNWDREASARLMASVADLAASVKVSRLAFLPDSRVRDYLMARENAPAAVATTAASSMLTEGKEIVITTGGYSMWPAIKPGDRIIISPPDPDKPVKVGSVVALRRDGGFVVHRVTAIQAGKLTTFIKTQGDASIIPDPWSTEKDVAGQARKIIRGNKTLKISRRGMPYFIGKIATTFVKTWNGLAYGTGK